MVILIFVMADELSILIVVVVVLALGSVGIKSLALAVDVEGLIMALEDDILNERRLVKVIEGNNRGFFLCVPSVRVSFIQIHSHNLGFHRLLVYL